MTVAQLQALLLSIAQNKFTALVALYNAINTGDTTGATTQRALIVKYDQLTDVVNQGINQLQVITNLTPPGP